MKDIISCYMKRNTAFFQGGVTFNDRLFTDYQVEFKSDHFVITNPKGGTVSAKIDNISYSGENIRVSGFQVFVDNNLKGSLKTPIWLNPPIIPTLHLKDKVASFAHYESINTVTTPTSSTRSALQKDTVFKQEDNVHGSGVKVIGFDFSSPDNTNASAEISGNRRNNLANKLPTYPETTAPTNTFNNSNTTTTTVISAVGIGEGTIIAPGAHVRIGNVTAADYVYGGNAPQGFFQQIRDNSWKTIQETDCFELSMNGKNLYRVTVSHPEIPDDKRAAVNELMERYVDGCEHEEEFTRSIDNNVKSLFLTKTTTANNLYAHLLEIVPKPTNHNKL
ncbi:MAG: hypothetical protein WC627_11120 [Legionella sp.]|jgi:hypothetical protein